MTTKPPAKVKTAEADSPVKKIYSIVDELKDIIPASNDRNRLSFCIYRYYQNEAGSLKEAIISAHPESCKISFKELEEILSNKYSKLNLNTEI